VRHKKKKKTKGEDRNSRFPSPQESYSLLLPEEILPEDDRPLGLVLEEELVDALLALFLRDGESLASSAWHPVPRSDDPVANAFLHSSSSWNLQACDPHPEPDFEQHLMRQHFCPGRGAPQMCLHTSNESLLLGKQTSQAELPSPLGGPSSASKGDILP
jgi:hypothetical protein